MARFSFGGGDYSGLFADLYQQQENEAKRQAAETKAQQAADDQDAYDQWKNGLTSDEEWLAYIARRRDETVAEPKEHEKWVKLERQYTRSIADNSAQLDYEAGRISASQYIAYQQGVLTELDPGSEVYRERAAVVQQLQDAAAQRDVSTRAQEVLDGIAMGKNTTKDLLKVYRDGLAVIRPGSELYKQVQSEIVKVEAQIRDDGARAALEKIQYDFSSNKLKGKDAGARIRAIAEQFYKNDPTKYYQVLQSAIGFEKYPGLYGAGTGGGGGSAVAKHVDTLKANIERLDNITRQYLQSGGQGAGVDPMTGAPIDFDDPSVINAIQQQGLKWYDQLKATYLADGKKSQAQNVATAKTQFILDRVQPINTIPKIEQGQNLIEAANKRLDAASQSNDPSAVLDEARRIGTEFLKWTDRMSQTLVPHQGGGEGGLIPSGQARSLQSQPEADFLAEMRARGQAYIDLAKPGLTEAEANSTFDLLNKATGKYFPDALTKEGFTLVASNNQMAEGLKTGNATYVVTPDGFQVVGYVERILPALDANGQMVMRSDRVVDISSVKGAQTGAEFQDAIIDVNGKATKVQAMVVPLSQTAYSVWVSQVTDEGLGLKKGQIVNSEVVRNLSGGRGGNRWEALVARGAVAEQPYDFGWQVMVIPEYTDNGKMYAKQVWVGDSNTGTWWQGASPVNFVHLLSDGTVEVKDGQPVVNWKAYGNASYLPVPMSGSDKKGANALVASGVINTQGIKVLNGQGQFVDAPPNYFNGAYYDPKFDRIDPYDKSGLRTFWDNAARLARSEDLKKIDQERQLRGRPAPVPPSSFGPVLDRVEQLARQFGINTGPAQQTVRPQTGQPFVPSPTTVSTVPRISAPIPGPTRIYEPVTAPGSLPTLAPSALPLSIPSTPIPKGMNPLYEPAPLALTTTTTVKKPVPLTTTTKPRIL